MSRWQIGPKFSAYLNMNLGLVKAELGFIIFYSLMYGYMGIGTLQRGNLSSAILYLTFSYIYIAINCVPKLYKDSLYSGQAMLFQSVPVSEFEIILAKTLAGTVGFVIALVCYGVVFTATLGSNEPLWRQIYGGAIEAGFSEGQMAAAAFLSGWCGLLLGFAASGICLFGCAAGHRLCRRWNRFAKLIATLLITSVMLAAVAGLIWLIWLPVAVPAMIRLIFIMAVCGALSVLLVRANLAAMEKWYCI